MKHKFSTLAVLILFAVSLVGVITSADSIAARPAQQLAAVAVGGQTGTTTFMGAVGIGTMEPETVTEIVAPGVFTNTQSNPNFQVIINGATSKAWYDTWHPGATGNHITEAITGAIDVPATATVHESAGIAGYVKSRKSSAYGSDAGGFFQAEAAANGTSVLGIDSECVVGAGLTSAICQNVFRTRIYSPGVSTVGLNVVLDGKVAPSTSHGVAVQASNASTKWGWGFVSLPGGAAVGLELAGVSKGNSVDSQPIKLTGTNASGVAKSATLYATKDGELLIQPQSLTSFTGKVGIGTSAPITPLHVIGNNGTGAIAAFQTTPTSSAVVLGVGTDKAVVQGVSNGSEGVLILNPQGKGNVGIGTTNPLTMIKLQVSGDTVQNDRANQFMITGATNPALRLRIGIMTNKPTPYADIGFVEEAVAWRNIVLAANGGNIGIGVTSPTAQLHTTGTVRFAKFGAGTLTTDASGNLSVSSDERLKHVDGAFTRGLADIAKITPIIYHWNALSGLDTSTEYTGFSAQNVQQAIPEAVGSSASGYLTLQDRPLIAAIVNAVKELSAKVTGQDAEIAELRAEVAALRAQMESQTANAGSATSVSGDY